MNFATGYSGLTFRAGLVAPARQMFAQQRSRLLVTLRFPLRSDIAVFGWKTACKTFQIPGANSVQ